MLPSSKWNRRLASQAGNTSSSLVGSTTWESAEVGESGRSVKPLLSS